MNASARLNAALVAHGWSPALSVRPARGRGHFDLVGADGQAFAFACVQTPGSDRRDEVCARLRADRHVTAAVLTDGTEDGTRFLRRLLGVERIEQVAGLDPWKPQKRGTWPGARPASMLETDLFEAHSHMRDLDGLHAPEALDELCKVLLLKLHDEAHGGRLDRRHHGSTDEFACAARRAFDEARGSDEAWSGLLLSDRALARCLEQLGGHRLGSLSLDVTGRAFQAVVAPAARSGMGQYFTPEAVARLIIRVLDPRPGERVLDPFAGSAHLLTLAAQHCDQLDLWGIEKSQRMMRVAHIDGALHGRTGVTLRCADALGPQGDEPGLGGVDVVATNPPFGSVLRSAAIASLGPYDTADGASSVPVEVLALERAVRFLKPGGRIGIVLPDGVLANTRLAAARDRIRELLAVRAVVSLPVETFAGFGANVKTSIVFGRRLTPGERQADEAEVLLVRADTADELPQVEAPLRAFLTREGW